jgi:hypothetical protein
MKRPTVVVISPGLVLGAEDRHQPLVLLREFDQDTRSRSRSSSSWMHARPAQCLGNWFRTP